MTQILTYPDGLLSVFLLLSGGCQPVNNTFSGVAGGHGRSWWAGTCRWVGRVHLSRAVNCFYYRYLDGTGKEFKAANLKEVVLLWHPCKLRRVLWEELPAAPLTHPQPGLGRFDLQKHFPLLFYIAQNQYKIFCKLNLLLVQSAPGGGRKVRKNY